MTTLHHAGDSTIGPGGYPSPSADDPKLRPPRQRRSIVDRTRLLAELLATRAQLVTVVAPPGYGKSTLLAQWCRTDPRPAAWVTVDDLDNDQTTLLQWLAVAISSLPGAGPAPGGALTGRRVGAMLATCEQPVILALDDMHTLHDLSAVDTLTNLLPYLPPGSVLALGSRTAPVTLGRLRVELDAVEIGPADLAFDPAEARAAASAEGVSLDQQEAEVLFARTEGWPALVTLAAIAGRHGMPFPQAASGDTRIVAEYLHSEVMGLLEPATVDFLHQSSILHRLTGPACDAILGRTGSTATLQALAAEHNLVLPVDGGRESYRYHPVLRDLLLAELMREDPDQLTVLRKRAAAWSIENGEPWAALAYEFEIGDLDASAALLMSIARPAWASGHASTVEHWLERLGRAGAMDHHPELAAMWAVTLTLHGQDLVADRWAEQALAVPAQPGADEGELSLAAMQLMLRALRCVEGPEQMRRDAQSHIGLLAPTSPWAATGIALTGVADLLQDDPAGAAEKLQAAIALARLTGAAGAEIASVGVLALLRADQHRWDEARTLVQQGQAVISRAGFGQYGLAGLVHAAAVRVHDHEGEGMARQVATAHFDALRPRMTHAGLPYAAVMGRLTVARVHRAHGEWEAARTLVGEMRTILDKRPNLGVLSSAVTDLAESIGDRRGGPLGGSTLSVAELRLLPFLPTHLSFRGIGERLYLSQHTIKTQALSIYRKLGATSRDEAVTRARELGLIDD